MLTPEQVAAQRIERIYSSDDEYDATLNEIGINPSVAFSGSSDVPTARARMANMVTVAAVTKRSMAEVAATWDANKRGYSKQIFGKEVTDDLQFFTHQKQFIERRRNERAMNEKMNTAMFQMAAQGMPYNDAFSAAREQFKGDPGWSEESERMGVYNQGTRENYNFYQQNIAAYEPLIEGVFQHMATSGGFRENVDAISDVLAGMPERQANLIIDAAAARLRHEATQTGDKGKTSMVAGGAKSMLVQARSYEQIMTGARKEAERIGKAVVREGPGWDGFWRDTPYDTPAELRKEAIERRIAAHLSGDLDEFKGDTWFSQRMLETSETLPYTFTAWTPFGLPIIIGSMKNDVRGQLIDSGVAPEDADKISSVAAPAMALIESAQAQMVVFGKIPFVKKGLGALKDATLKRVMARMGVRAVGFTAGQVGEELVQTLPAPTVQEIFSWVDEDVPEANFKEVFAQWPEMTLELAVTLAPLGLWPASTSTRFDYKETKRLIDAAANKDVLIADGYTEQDAEAISQAKDTNPIAFVEAVNAAQANRDMNTEQAQEARDKLQAQLDANAIGAGVSVSSNGNGGYTVKSETGVTATAPNAEEAAKTLADIKQTESAKAVEQSTTDLISRVDAMTHEEFSAMPRGEGAKTDPHEIGLGLTSETQVEQLEKAEAKSRERADAFLKEKKIDESMDEGLKAQFYREIIDAARGEGGAGDSIRKNRPGAVFPLPKKTEQKAEPITPKTLEKSAKEIKEPEIKVASDQGTAKPATIALNKAEIEMKREADNLQRLPEPERERQAEVFNKVKLEDKGGALDLAKEILKEPRAITVEEHAMLLIEFAKAENRYTAHLQEALAWDEKGDAKRAKAARIRADAALAEIDIITEAGQRSGTIAGRALAIRRARIELESYSYVGVMNRARNASKTSQIDPETEKKLAEAATEIKRLEAEIQKLVDELSVERAKEVKKSSRTFIEEAIRGRSRAAKANAAQNREKYKARLREMGIRANDITNIPALSIEQAWLVSKIAETYVAEGVDSLSAVLGKIKADLPDLSDNDIYNSLGGRIKEVKTRVEDELKRKLKEIKKQAALWAKVHDLLDGKVEQGKKPLSQSDTMKLLSEIVTELRMSMLKTVNDEQQLQRLEEKFKSVREQLVGGFRNLTPEEQEKREREDITQARERLADIRREMATLDALYEAEEAQRLGELPEAPERKEEKNPRILEMREKIAAIRKELRKNPEDIEDKKIKSLLETIEKLDKQIAGETTGDKKARAADSQEVAILKDAANRMRKIVRAQTAIKDIEEQLRTGKFREGNKSKETDPMVASLMQTLGELRKDLREAKRLPGTEEGRREALQAKLESLREQFEGGYRTLKEPAKKRVEVSSTEEIQKQIREIETLMRLEDANFDLEEQLRTGVFKLSDPEARVMKNAELLNLQVRNKQLKREVDNAIRHLGKMTWQDWALEAWATPRAMQSMIDASFVLKQGVWMVWKHPILSAKAAGGAFKSAFSEREMDEIDIAIRNHPNYADFMFAGLKLTEVDGTPTKREEHFYQNLAERIWGVKHAVRGSNRAMMTYLNLVRVGAMNNFLDAHPGATAEERAAMADYINITTGRGNFGKAEGAIQTLNFFFYAPRFAWSRFQLMYAPIKNWNVPKVRNIILWDFAKFWGFNMTVLGLASIAGFEVGDDPEEWTFLKIKVGNTWQDFLGSMQQPARMLAIMVMSGKRLGEGEASNKKSMEMLFDFLRYKINPAFTTSTNFLEGTDTFGREAPRWQLAAEGFTPIIMGETYDIVTQAETPQDATFNSVMTFFGTGSTTPEPKNKRSTFKQEPR